jgi:hypothetical protein
LEVSLGLVGRSHLKTKTNKPKINEFVTHLTNKSDKRYKDEAAEKVRADHEEISH